jgi:hypothetical protein
VSKIKASVRRLFNLAKGQVTEKQIRRLSSVTTEIKKAERPLGGTAAGGSRMYLTGETNEDRSQLVSQQGGFY